jgi:type IX secretion system PorP/SprF family membrane protein
MITVEVLSQQDAQYTQYMYNMNILNPAYAGINPGTLNVSLLGRKQWVGIPGAPETAVLSVHSPVMEGMGLGLSVLADKIGPINEQFVYVDYSYTIPVGYYDNLAFGVKGGVTLLNASLSDLRRVMEDDENFVTDINNAKPNFGFGAFYYSDIYYVGISVPNILQTEYLEKTGNIVSRISKRNHIFLTGGYVFDLSYDWKFKPSTMIKASVGAPLSVDLSANFLFDDTYEIGGSYRWGDSASLLLGARVNDMLKVGYSYDFTTTELNRFNSGTHELILLFDILTSYDIVSPRFF